MERSSLGVNSHSHSRRFCCICRLSHKMEQLPYLSFLAGNHRAVPEPCLWGVFGSLGQRVPLWAGPRCQLQQIPESGQTCSSNSPRGTTSPAQATGTAWPAKDPFGPATRAAFLRPHPTSAPWPLSPPGSLHLGGGCCSEADRNVSIPRFQVFSKLLGMNMPLAAQHQRFISSHPSALKLQQAAEIPSGV